MRFLILLVSLLQVQFLFAAESPVEAGRRVAAELFRASSDNQPIELTDVVLSSEGADTLAYVYQNPYGKGFAVVTADALNPEALAYSTENDFNKADIQWMVQSLSEARKNMPQTALRSLSTEDFPPIAPLLMDIAWNQSPLYNDKCPVDSATNTRTYAGCVPTAFGQLLRYWEYPSCGKGVVSTEFQGKTYSADLSAFPLDYASMPSTLENASDEEIDAVSTLLYHCGLSVNAMYGTEATGSSLLYLFSSAQTNFSYKADSLIMQGIDEAAIYNDLKEGRPVAAAADAEIGHAFVVDGYDKNHFFHVNFGWGGQSNGYYRLDYLNAYNWKSDVYRSGFSWVKGLCPDVTGEVKVSGARLLDDSVSLLIGERYVAPVKIIPAYASDRQLKWSSDNTAVATVSEFGEVTALKNGRATITVTTNDGGFVDRLVVAVDEKKYEDPCYVLVHSTDEIVDYDKIIIVQKQNSVALSDSVSADSIDFIYGKKVTISGDTVRLRPYCGVEPFLLIKKTYETWFLQDEKGAYISADDANQLAYVKDLNAWRIEIDGQSHAKIIQEGNTLSISYDGGRFVSTNGQTTEGQSVYIYKMLRNDGKLLFRALAEEGGFVSSNVNGYYAANGEIQVTAYSKDHYLFDGWSDGVKTPERTIILTSDTVITARFVRNVNDTIPLDEFRELYILGNIEGVDWSEVAPGAMKRIGKNLFEGVFAFTEDISYFAFCTKYGDWDVVNNTRWAGADNDLISPSAPGKMVNGGDGSCFTIKKGTYLVSVDMDAKTCKVKKPSDASCDVVQSDSNVQWFGNRLVVSNPSRQCVSIYSSTGALIYRAYGDCEYTFDEKGAYLVQIGKEALKVLR